MDYSIGIELANSGLWFRYFTNKIHWKKREVLNRQPKEASKQGRKERLTPKHCLCV